MPRLESLPKRVGYALFALVVLPQFANSEQSDEAEKVRVLAQIIDTWKANEARFDSLRCVWDESRLYMPQSVVRPETSPIAPDSEDRPVFPNGWPIEPVLIEAPHSVLLHGNWMRNEETIIGCPSSPEQRHHTTIHQSTFDGDSSLSLSNRGDHGEVVKHQATSNIDAICRNWRPLKTIVRPLNESFRSTFPNTLSVVEIDSAGGRAVLKNHAYTEFVVDLNRDCFVVASHQQHPKTGRMLWDYDVQLRQGQQDHWVPEGWEFRVWNQAEPQDLSTRDVATVSTFDFGMPLTKDDFQLALPTSLTVYNQATGSRWHDIVSPRKEESSDFTLRTWLVMASVVILVACVCFIRKWTVLHTKRGELK